MFRILCWFKKYKNIWGVYDFNFLLESLKVFMKLVCLNQKIKNLLKNYRKNIKIFKFAIVAHDWTAIFFWKYSHILKILSSFKKCNNILGFMTSIFLYKGWKRYVFIKCCQKPFQASIFERETSSIENNMVNNWRLSNG